MTQFPPEDPRVANAQEMLGGDPVLPAGPGSTFPRSDHLLRLPTEPPKIPQETYVRSAIGAFASVSATWPSPNSQSIAAFAWRCRARGTAQPLEYLRETQRW